jgi:hypothetical protein
MVNNFILYGKVPLLIVQDHPSTKETSLVHITVRENSPHIPVQAALADSAGTPVQGQKFN